jgi:hypothetical protein
MKRSLTYAGRSAAVMVPAALLTGFGLPALAALVFLAVLVLGVVCWIIGNPDRSDRVNRMMLARRGDARCLADAPAPQPRRQGIPSRRKTNRDTAAVSTAVELPEVMAHYL